MKTLKGKVAVITGAGSGIGRAIALRFADEGVISVLADINGTALQETLALVEARGGKASIQILDIRDGSAFQIAADNCIHQHGAVDILVNNAGVLSRNVSFLEMDVEHQRFVFDVNFWGMVNGSRAFVPLLAQRPEAALVNVASSLALCGAPFHSAYCASKSAVMAYSEIMRVELSRSNIALTLVFPGAAKTNLGANVATLTAEESEKTAKNFDRFATTSPEKIAAKVVAAITGQKSRITTGVDGFLSATLGRFMPVYAHALMNWAYRKVGDPVQFAFIDGLSGPPK